MQQQKYFSQLDGLRAIAIILVILFHWFPESGGVNVIKNGPLGVTLFFVISGFLITRILLLNRNSANDERLTPVYKSFIMRRVLRIFPLYYLLLFAVWLSQFVAIIPKIETDFFHYPGYYLLYISNFLIEQTHNWSDTLSTLWSLAVEEQFYIFWPFVILQVPERNLKNVIIGTVILGISSRVFFSFIGYNEGVLMPACLDAFGAGAFWAYVIVYNKIPAKILGRLKLLAVVGLALFLFFCFEGKNTFLHTMLFRTSMSVFCLYLVAGASYGAGFQNIVGWCLNNVCLRYIGKISYGIYVYHLLVPSALIPFLVRVMNRFFHIDLVFSDWSMKAVSLVTLIVVASLSWHLFEVPFTRLKHYFTLKADDITANKSHFSQDRIRS